MDQLPGDLSSFLRDLSEAENAQLHMLLCHYNVSTDMLAEHHWQLVRLLVTCLGSDQTHGPDHALWDYRTARYLITGGRDRGLERDDDRSLLDMCLCHDIGYVFPGDTDQDHVVKGSKCIAAFSGMGIVLTPEQTSEMQIACHYHGILPFLAGTQYEEPMQEEAYANTVQEICQIQAASPDVYTRLLAVMCADLLDQTGIHGLKRSSKYYLRYYREHPQGKPARRSNGETRWRLHAERKKNPNSLGESFIDNMTYWLLRPYRTLRNLRIRKWLIGDNTGEVDEAYRILWHDMYERAFQLSYDYAQQGYEKLLTYVRFVAAWMKANAEEPNLSSHLPDFDDWLMQNP
ncbi:MAG TPA: hypothetical protein PKL83_05630 [bacterium]|nr:hypothetical protein [bacterium]